MFTVQEKVTSLLEVNKSKFYAIIVPIGDVDEFKPMLESVRKEYTKAKHVVYAYRIGDKSKSNDDQEPKGTAGRPLLELLHKKEMNNVVIFVARYFGGVKLGASRLLRTYLQSGIDAINKATLVEIRK